MAPVKSVGACPPARSGGVAHDARLRQASTICEVARAGQKQGAAYGCTKELGYHPLLADAPTPARCSAPACGSKAPRGHREAWCASSTSSSRTCDAPGLPGRVCAPTRDSGPALIDRLDAHDFKRPSDRWQRSKQSPAPHGPTSPNQQRPRPVAETDLRHRPRQSEAHRPPRRAPHPPRRGAHQQRLWPDWRHHAFITNTEHDTAAADEFHRAHAVVEPAIRDLKEGSGLEHVPSGHYGANCAWLACAVLAHNIGHWTTALAGAPPATNRSRRTRLVALPPCSP